MLLFCKIGWQLGKNGNGHMRAGRKLDELLHAIRMHALVVSLYKFCLYEHGLLCDCASDNSLMLSSPFTFGLIVVKELCKKCLV